MKEFNSVELVEFAKSKELQNKTVFAWWVPYALRKRDIIITKLKVRIRKTIHKFDIEISTTVEQAKKLDKINSNTLWQNTITKKIHNLAIVFLILENDEPLLPGWRIVTEHIIYDCKIDFTRKAR